MKFHYYKSAKRRGVEGFIFVTFFLLMFVSAELYIFFKKQEQFFSSDYIVWFLCVFFLIMYAVSYRIYKNPDKWNIQITDTEVVWESPAILGEKSFQVKTSNISKIICEEPFSSDSSNSYYLYFHDGEKIEITSSLSGLNLNKFIKVLVKQGIKYEYIKS